MKNTTPNGTGFAKPRRRSLHDKLCLLLMGFLIIMPTVLGAGDQKDDKSGDDTSSSVLVNAVETASTSLVSAVEMVGECLVSVVEMVGGLLVSVAEVLNDSLATIQKGCESARESVEWRLHQDASHPPKADNAESPAPASANEVAKAPTAASEQSVAASLAEKPQSSTSSTVAAEPEMDDEPIEIMSDPSRDAEFFERRKDPARAAAAAKFLRDL